MVRRTMAHTGEEAARGAMTTFSLEEAYFDNALFGESSKYFSEVAVLKECAQRTHDPAILREATEIFNIQKDFSDDRVHPLTFNAALLYPIARRAVDDNNPSVRNARRALKTYAKYAPEPWEYVSAIFGDQAFISAELDSIPETDERDIANIAKQVQPQSMIFGAAVTLADLKQRNGVDRRLAEHYAESFYEQVCGFTGFDAMKSAIISAREKSEKDDPESNKYERIARMALSLLGERGDAPTLFAAAYKELFGSDSENQHSVGDASSHGLVVIESLLLDPTVGVDGVDVTSRIKSVKSAAKKIKRETEEHRNKEGTSITYPLQLTFDGETFVLPADLAAGTIIARDVNEQMLLFSTMVKRIKGSQRLRPIPSPSRYLHEGGDEKFIHIRGSEKIVALARLCLSGVAEEPEIDDRTNKVKKAYTVLKATFEFNSGDEDDPNWIPMEVQHQSRKQRLHGRVGANAAHDTYKKHGKDETLLKSSGKAMRQIRKTKEHMKEDIVNPDSARRGASVRAVVAKYMNRPFFEGV